MNYTVTEKLLNAVTATGAGTALAMSNAHSAHTFQVVHSNSGGSTTAMVVTIQASLDGTTWDTLGTAHTLTSAELSAGTAMFHFEAMPVAFLRANLTTLTDTGTTTVHCYYLGA